MTGAAFLHGLVTAALVIAVVCLAVRFLLPVVLHLLVEPVRDCVSLAAALFLLPEYWVSRSRRREGTVPIPFAYAYGDGIAHLAGLGDRSVVLLFRSLARAAAKAPPLAVAGVTAAWELSTLF
ncbi:hypothetical protein [Amycolatopsis sp. La24]|uniref:hypothetical protein n=1 Tax=Amycolatopsis sp. La24 TaxID=3028304 RepID=UPI0023B03B18|nr:hypothetical protein [Amycolatopsis sp. La24]